VPSKIASGIVRGSKFGHSGAPSREAMRRTAASTAGAVATLGACVSLGAGVVCVQAAANAISDAASQRNR
jgi:hypothetical protein